MISSGRIIARVSAPASVANFGVGFDVHSMALEQPRIRLQLERAPRNVRKIRVHGPYANDTTTDPNLNSSGQALDNFYEEFGRSHGYLLKIQVNTPPRAGLGLSGSEAVGAVLCAAVGLDLEMSREEVARFAARVEPMNHMDNVAACARRIQHRSTQPIKWKIKDHHHSSTNRPRSRYHSAERSQTVNHGNPATVA